MTIHFAPTPLRAAALAVLMSASAVGMPALAQGNRPAGVRADTQVTLNFVNSEIDAVTRAMAAATILEPLLIVAMGLVVLAIVMAVLQPIIQLQNFAR